MNIVYTIECNIICIADSVYCNVECIKYIPVINGQKLGFLNPTHRIFIY